MVNTGLMSRREALCGALSLATALTVSVDSAAKDVSVSSGHAITLEAQRLERSGVHLREGGLSLFVDPWASPAIWDGVWTTPIPDIVAEQKLNEVAVTHLHQDHFDSPLIKKLLASGGSVICQEPIAARIASRGIAVRPVSLFHPTTIGDPVVGELTLAPIHAVDGAGDDQCPGSQSVGDVVSCTQAIRSCMDSGGDSGKCMDLSMQYSRLNTGQLQTLGSTGRHF